MTPLNAKGLLKALQENLAKYEEKFGEIRMPADAGFEAQDRGIGFQHEARLGHVSALPAPAAIGSWPPFLPSPRSVLYSDRSGT